MKRLYLLILGLVSLSVLAAPNWLHIYYKSKDLHKVVALPLAEIDSVYYTAASTPSFDIKEGNLPGLDSIAGDSIPEFLNVLSKDGATQSVKLDAVEDICLGTNIPTVYITTTPAVSDVSSKTDYLKGTFRYEPYDGSDTVVADFQIRGRGNSSWEFPKRAYRLKFDKKQQIGPLRKAKSFVMLANYIDNTLLKNALAFKLAQMFDMPYANNFQPVNVYFNGIPKGSYLITEKVGINSGSVDIEEADGILWEIDLSMDEDFCYRSEVYNLPCMVKDPDFYEVADGDEEKVQEMWDFWKADLDSALHLLDAGRWDEAFDRDLMLKYVLIYDIMQNSELTYPKSMFLWKEHPEDKYSVGPIWDFDWCTGYDVPVDAVLINKGLPGEHLFDKIFDEEFMEQFGVLLDDFCDNRLDEFFQFFDEYAATIRVSALTDAYIWPDDHFNTYEELDVINKKRFDAQVLWLKNWLKQRLTLMRRSPNYLLYK